MFSLLDLEEVCGKEGGAEKFLEENGIIMDGKLFSMRKASPPADVRERGHAVQALC